MADYVSILNRAISAHGESTEETRRKIYDKARKALTRQLSSLEPPLSAEDISKQLLPLEEAIREIEGGYAEAPIVTNTDVMEPAEAAPVEPTPEPQAAVAPEPQVAQEPEVAPVPVATPEPQTTVEPEVAVDPTPAPSPMPQPDMAKASNDQTEVKTDEEVTSAPVNAPEPQPEPVLQPEPAPMPAPEPVIETPEVAVDSAPKVSEEPAPVIASVDPAPQAQATPDQVQTEAPEPMVAAAMPTAASAQQAPESPSVAVREDLPSPEPKVEPSPLDEAVEALEAAGMPSPAPSGPEPGIDNKPAAPEAPSSEPQQPDLTGFGDMTAKQDADFLEDEPIDTAPKKRRGITYALVGTLVLLILVGTGALAWLQRDNVSQIVTQISSQLGDLANSFSSEPSTENNNASNTTDPAPNTVEKNEDRLLNTPLDLSENNTPSADQPRDVTPLGRTELPDDVAETPPPVSPVVVEPTTTTPPAPETTTVAEPDTTVVETPLVETAEETQPPVAAAPTVNLFGASAILYEEVGTGSGQTNVSNGSILWELVPNGSEAIGAEGLPSVRGAVTIQSRDLRVRFEILRNLDESLPASHLIEVEFNGGPLFNGDAINNITAVVLKPSEQQKGRALAGAVAKVSDNVFWLAMSNSAADLAANTDALKQQSWIDIPVVFQSGKRAILTLEKGAAGAKAVERAFEDWTGNS